jgi:hypothetical protein
MALSEFEIKKIEKEMSEFLEQIRPPVSIRNEVDIEFKLNNQAIELYEVRPQWDDKSKITRMPVAKIAYTKSSKMWKLYWMRADLKWHKYEPYHIGKTLKELLGVVKQDEYGCFWG